jgi:hypothetical protein
MQAAKVEVLKTFVCRYIIGCMHLPKDVTQALEMSLDFRKRLGDQVATVSTIFTESFQVMGSNKYLVVNQSLYHIANMLLSSRLGYDQPTRIPFLFSSYVITRREKNLDHFERLHGRAKGNGGDILAIFDIEWYEFNNKAPLEVGLTFATVIEFLSGDSYAFRTHHWIIMEHLNLFISRLVDDKKFSLHPSRGKSRPLP